MKFGGSSVKDAERIKYVTKLVLERLNQKPVLVFSAMGKTTDKLLALGAEALTGKTDYSELKEYHWQVCEDLKVKPKELDSMFTELGELLRGIALIKELSPKTKDYLVSFGERLSVRIISAYLDGLGQKVNYFDGWDAGIVTNSNFTEAEILSCSYNNIYEKLGNLDNSYDFIPVVTGFIAKDKNGNITTFGRGGSDLTASVLGAALKVAEIQVWKDVDGILTTDPRIVSRAKPVPNISFEEAAELAYFGAKVLHPLSIQPAMAHGIPVRVKNSYNPDHPGTIIIGTTVASEGLVKAITCKRKVTVVDLTSTRMLGQHGFLAQVFKIFSEAEISVDMVATSEVSVSVTLNNRTNIDDIKNKLEEFSEVHVEHNKAILSLIGDITRSSEMLDSVFSILRKNDINVQMISQGASKVNIGFIVEDTEVERCVNELHLHFFEMQDKTE
jgi:aspartate kinase